LKIFFSIFIISISLFGASNKRSSYLKFMYKPSKSSIENILIHNLEGNESVNNRLIKYYLDLDKIKIANYYSKKNKKIKSEFGFMINSELLLKLKKDNEAIMLLKKALFELNSENAFYLLQKLYYKKGKKIKNFPKVIEKGVELNPYLISYYYSSLAKNSSIKKQRELFEKYLSYSNDLRISEYEFKNINLTEIQQLYYLEKLILKNNYKWAKKLYKSILFENPYLINLRRVLILRK